MWRPALAGHSQAEGQASLSSPPDQPQLRNKGRRIADFTNATAGEWRRLTSRCSRRGRITAFHGVKSLQPAPLPNFVLRALTTLACACTRIRVQYLDEEARVGASAAKPRMEAGSARGQGTTSGLTGNS